MNFNVNSPSLINNSNIGIGNGNMGGNNNGINNNNGGGGGGSGNINFISNGISSIVGGNGNMMNELTFGFDEEDIEILKRIENLKEEIKILNEKEIDYLEISYEIKYNLDLLKLENKLFEERINEIENKINKNDDE